MPRRARARASSTAAAAAPPRPALPGWDTAVAALSLVYVAMVLYVWVRRAAYPYELEWLEGAALEHVQRLRHGLPLYTAPTLAWVPLNYTPLYFWLCAVSTLVFGETFLAMRVVSILSAVGAGLCLWLLVRRESGRPAAAWLAVGLFASAFRLGGAWLDVARGDSLHLALLLAGACVARFDASRWRMPLVAGALFALAFLTKQSAAMAIGPLLLWLAITDRPRGLVLAGVFGALAVSSVFALDAASGGWFRYYAYTVPAFHKTSFALLSTFPVKDVGRSFAPLLGAIVLAAVFARGQLSRTRWTFHVALAAGFLALGWALRLYPGGYDNVLVPAHAALALLGALAFAALAARGGWPAAAGALLLSGQLALTRWDAAAQVPTAADRAAGDELVKGTASLPGRLYFSSHTYLLERAGRPAHAHVMPLMDVIRDGHGPREQALLATLRDSLAAHAWDQAVLDNRDWLYEEFTHAGYRPVVAVFPNTEVFWPVTGMRTRPEYLLVAPGYAGTRPQRADSTGAR